MCDLSAIFGGSFNTHSVEPMQDYAPLPPGKYSVVIEEVDILPTKANTGHYIKVSMAVVGGEHNGRKLWDRINIDNPSEKCVEIGLRCLAALGQAIGLSEVKDSSQFLGCAVVAHVKIDGEYNSVRTYSAVPGQAQQTAASAATVTQTVQQQVAQQPSQSAPSRPSKPPWAK